MDRRTVLHGSALVLCGALAGCTEQTLEEAETKPPFLDINDEELRLPVTQRADVVEEGVMLADDAAIPDLESFESFLSDNGLPVERLDEVERIIEEKLEIEREDVDVIEETPHGEGVVLELEFVQEDAGGGILHPIGLIAGGFAALVEEGADAEKLDATVLDAEHRPFGSFHVLAAWAEEFNGSETTAREFGSKAWSTAKSP